MVASADVLRKRKTLHAGPDDSFDELSSSSGHPSAVSVVSLAAYQHGRHVHEVVLSGGGDSASDEESRGGGAVGKRARIADMTSASAARSPLPRAPPSGASSSGDGGSLMPGVLALLGRQVSGPDGY
jgi:hypothetical protein